MKKKIKLEVRIVNTETVSPSLGSVASFPTSEGRTKDYSLASPLRKLRGSWFLPKGCDPFSYLRISLHLTLSSQLRRGSVELVGEKASKSCRSPLEF